MTGEDHRRWHWFATTQPLTCASVDIDVDVDTAICFLGARLPCTSVNALHCSWLVQPRTRAFENPLLDSRSRSVEVALVLDLETRTALSLHELFNLLCRTLKRFPRSAGLTLSFGAVRPQVCIQSTNAISVTLLTYATYAFSTSATSVTKTSTHMDIDTCMM